MWVSFWKSAESTELFLLMPQQGAEDYEDDCYQKNEDGNPVHAMHQKDVHVPGFIGVSLPQVQIPFDLIPDAELRFGIRTFFHSGKLRAQFVGIHRKPIFAAPNAGD